MTRDDRAHGRFAQPAFAAQQSFRGVRVGWENSMAGTEGSYGFGVAWPAGNGFQGDNRQ